MHRRRWKVTEGLVALGLSSLAHADPEPVRASLEVRAPDSCGAPRLLMDRVERRSDRIRFVEPGARVRRIRAEVRDVAPRDYRATLSLWTDDGRELVRELRASHCAEAFDALALVIAVTLDPEADLAAEPAREPLQSEGAAPDRATRSRADAASAARAPASPPAPASAAASAVDEPRADNEPGSAAPQSGGAGSPFAPSFGVVGSVRAGPAPAALPGFGLFIGLEGFPGFPERSLVRLSALRHGRGSFEASGGIAEFELDTLRLDPCPFGFGQSSLRAYLCLEAELGELEAAGSATVDEQRESRPWRSFGVAALLAYLPVSALELGLLGAIEHPLVRDTFQFEPEAFHEVGPVGGRLELGLGLRLP